MAKYEKKTNYREKYPGLSNEIIEALEKSDRKMEYQQYDIKVERCRIDYTSDTVTYLPSREDSYDRLLEENRQFAADGESVDDAVIKAVMIEEMLVCLKLLTSEEQELIINLFFKDKSEHQLSRETGVIVCAVFIMLLALSIFLSRDFYNEGVTASSTKAEKGIAAD